MATRESFMTTGRVEKGRLKTRNLKAMESAFKSWKDCEVTITIERAHATRSAQSNRYYWAAVIQPIADHTGYTPEETHEILKQMFLPKKVAMCDGNGDVCGEFVIGGSTTKLNKVEFSEYIARIRDFAGEHLGVEILSAHEREIA